MTTFFSFLVLLQAIGALVGALAMVRGEFLFYRHSRKGKHEHAARTHLDHVAFALRFGMILFLCASLGIVIISYDYGLFTSPALLGSYWGSMVLSLLVVAVSWALSRERITFAYGSAILFSAWWFLTFLSFGWFPLFSFSALVMSFLISVVLLYFLLQFTHAIALRSR